VAGIVSARNKIPKNPVPFNGRLNVLARLGRHVMTRIPILREYCR